MELRVILFVSLIDFVLPAPDVSCVSQWQSYNECMKSQLAKSPDPTSGLPKPTSSVLENLQASNIRSCFVENRCSDPLGPQGTMNPRAKCFPSALNGLRNELQSCAQKTLRNFVLPQDEYSNVNGAIQLMYFLASSALQNIPKYCSNVRQEQVTSCLWRKWSSSAITSPPSSTGDYCSTVRQCKSTSSMSSSCDLGWNDLMCPCVQNAFSSGIVSKYENQYIDCMRQAGVTVDRNNDPPLIWLGSSAKGWCDSASTIRSSASWAPGNRYCDPATPTTTTTTTKLPNVVPNSPTDQPAIGSTDQSIEPDQTDQPIDQTDQPTDQTDQPIDQTNQPDQPDNQQSLDTSPPESQPTTPSPGLGDLTTQQTWFFDQFTFPTQAPEEIIPTTPEPIVVTTRDPNWPSFLGDTLGIQNPMNGAFGDLLHGWSNIFGQGGRRK